MTYQRKDHLVPPPSGHASSIEARDVEAAVLADLIMDEVNAPAARLSAWDRFKRKFRKRARPSAPAPAADADLEAARAGLREARRVRAATNRFSPARTSLTTLMTLGEQVLGRWHEVKGDALGEHRVTSLLGPDLTSTLKAFEGRDNADEEFASQIEVLVRAARSILEDLERSPLDTRDSNGRYLEDKYASERDPQS